MSQQFDFQQFANGFTNYLILWLSLIAQLPYETGSPWSNLMALCLAVGSPALSTFSLTLTVLNRFWIRQAFEHLMTQGSRRWILERNPTYKKRARNMMHLLQEVHQAPMRASQQHDGLRDLIVATEDITQAWWRGLMGRLRDTRRGVTFSLVAQMAAAAVSWLFLLILSFLTISGDVATGLQIALSSLWLWMIPVILGWIIVGVRTKANAIETALTTDHAFPNVPIRNRLLGHRTSEHKAIEERSSLNLRPEQKCTGGNSIAKACEIPRWIRGDEARRGPIYNYSRVFTWYQFAQTAIETLESVIDTVEHGNQHTPGCAQRRGSWPQSHSQLNFRTSNFSGNRQNTSSQVAQSGQEVELQHFHSSPQVSTLQSSSKIDSISNFTIKSSSLVAAEAAITSDPAWGRYVKAYPEFREVPSKVWKRITVASFMAMFVQWGTTGPAIMMAYLTPTVGLGCRSGSYLLYGVSSTMVWLSLSTSASLSHAVMLSFQRAQPYVDDFTKHPRSQGQIFLSVIAVILRYFGKSLAIVNALWLLVVTLLEFVGGYQNCWCATVQLSLGDHGWLALFKTTRDIQNQVNIPWIMGVMTSVVVCTATTIFFWLGSRKERKD